LGLVCISIFLVYWGYLFHAIDTKKNIQTDDIELFAKKTTVIPLPVLPFNEHYYHDDVKVLDYYESVIRQLRAVGAAETSFQIGGDQLTMERFSHAKFLRLENLDPNKRFAHIAAITGEFFHLGMKYLEKITYGTLWNAKGVLRSVP
jgi:hypothetical protein